jgi:hypothetical protein
LATTGALADTIGYDPLFACPAIVDVIGATILRTLLRRPRQKLRRKTAVALSRIVVRPVWQ